MYWSQFAGSTQNFQGLVWIIEGPKCRQAKWCCIIGIIGGPQCTPLRNEHQWEMSISVKDINSTHRILNNRRGTSIRWVQWDTQVQAVIIRGRVRQALTGRPTFKIAFQMTYTKKEKKISFPPRLEGKETTGGGQESGPPRPSLRILAAAVDQVALTAADPLLW